MIERSQRKLGLQNWVLLATIYLCAPGCMLPDSGGTAAVQDTVVLPTGGSAAVGAAGGEVNNVNANPPNAAAGSATTGGDCDAAASCSTESDIQDKPQFCGGACKLAADSPPTGVIHVSVNSVFAFRQTLIPPNAIVTALGAVTSTAPDVNFGQQGHFKLGFYSEVGMMPAELLAETEELTAQDSSNPTEGRLSRSVTLAENQSISYWIIMAVTRPYDLYIEKYDRPVSEDVLFALDTDCLPLSSPGCPMPTFTKYGAPNVTLPSLSVEPFMFAKFEWM